MAVSTSSVVVMMIALISRMRIVGRVGGIRVRDAVPAHQQTVRVHAVRRAGHQGRVIHTRLDVQF